MLRRLPLAASSSVRARALAPLARWQPPPRNYRPDFGDYPRLPWLPFDKRSPYQHWDDPVHRRNFGETIPEEFDVQDAWFQGDHDPVHNLKEGLKGQAAIASILITFLVAGYLLHVPDIKPPKRELPPEVVSYLQETGWDKVKERPYDVPKYPMTLTFLNPDTPLPATSHAHH